MGDMVAETPGGFKLPSSCLARLTLVVPSARYL